MGEEASARREKIRSRGAEVHKATIFSRGQLADSNLSFSASLRTLENAEKLSIFKGSCLFMIIPFFAHLYPFLPIKCCTNVVLIKKRRFVQPLFRRFAESFGSIKKINDIKQKPTGEEHRAPRLLAINDQRVYKSTMVLYHLPSRKSIKIIRPIVTLREHRCRAERSQERD